MAATKRCSQCGVVKAADTENFYRSKRPGDGGFRARCKSCEAIARGKTPPAPKKKNEKTPESPPLRQIVKCSCGHEYTFTMQRLEAIEWLRKKPCPPCQANLENKGPSPTPDAPEVPQKKEKPPVDKAWVDSVMSLLPVELFHSLLPDLILQLRAGLTVWMQGPPGTSKSTLAEQAATALGLKYYYQQCHEFMTRTDLFGFTDANGTDHRTPLWNAFEYGGVLLLDEVDNGNPNLTASMNGAIANGWATFGSGTTVQKHPDFRLVATANTAGLGPEHGFIGRNGVDLAARDRFVTLQVNIDDDLEAALAELHSGREVDALIPEFTKKARKALERRSRSREGLEAAEILATVRKVRSIVEARFRGSVISPRTTIHVAAMCAAGFTLREGLKAKLPGVKPADVETILKEANV